MELGAKESLLAAGNMTHLAAAPDEFTYGAREWSNHLSAVFGEGLGGNGG